MRRTVRRPSGRRIPVHGREMHVLETGAGGPTVILDGPDGAGTTSMCGLAASLAPYARVVRYDRAGYAWSDAAPTPLTADDSAQDLRTALERAEVAGPFLLVGYAYGGSVLRCFGYRYRRDVSGMVLVDAPPVGFLDRGLRMTGEAAGWPGARQSAFRWWARGHERALPRCAYPVYATPEPGGAPGCRERRGRDAQARAGERARLPESEREVASSPIPAGVPLVSIRHDAPPCSEHLPEADRELAAELWVQLHDELVADRPGSRVVRVRNPAQPAGPERPWESLAEEAVRRMLAG